MSESTPMAGNVLLDTNVVIALFAGDRAVLRRKRTSERVFVPATVIGELAYGALKSTQAHTNLAKIGELVNSSVVLPCDTATAHHYGEVKSQLHKSGQLLPDNDLWIAALALQHHLTLITRDGHFARIEGLSVEAW